jgi:hypothetical protein
MARKRKKAAKTQQQQQRPISLDTLKHFWALMAHYFPELRINICLFNYKAEGDKRPLVKHDVEGYTDIPVAQAYEAVLGLLGKYHEGEDILWKPSPSLTETSMLWVDDFRFDNELGLKPLFYIQTSPDKYQAYFKLTEAVPVEKAAELQKILIRLTGDKAASGYTQPRRMAGLANGKYEDDPLVIMLKGEEGDGILSPDQIIALDQSNLARARGGVAETKDGVAEDMAQETQGQGQEPKAKRVGGMYIKPVVPANYKPVLIKDRSAFIKRRPDGTIDDSATDMGWATSIARLTYESGWDDAAIVLTIYEILGNKSPELQRRKRTPKHARQYLYITAWKALRLVKKESEIDPRIAF